ncbi:hypothetical protein GPECTOR_19g264 [Gonium pectorale]|uniref:Uncharacterized protein n=1 Tax=Gonium pectorale TaxID=33097 RepID=A0A150GJ17_GONPE|nr:hypothetical protein GPECTOR_19g264 [Gonium pectorale]|eukprot:KXZ49813.1 hypothetical protein GPECTOR_19g264 [Gonium pectorale]
MLRPSYGRSLELAPGRLFSRLQAAALHYQMGEMPAALSYYRTALAAAPGHAAALLGCGEVLLAQAALAARLGAAGGAAAELAEADTLAREATRRYGNLQAGWKLLGDVRMQHAAVPTLQSVAATRGSVVASLPPATAAGSASGTGAAEVRGALDAARARLAALRSGRRAYAAAVHLDPRVAGLWGDLGLSYHLQLELAGQHPELERDAEAPPALLRRRALSLVRGGLRLEPVSDWLWATAGTIAAAAATAAPGGVGGVTDAAAAALAGAGEYCLSRSLQLNPRRAAVWAALGRLYASHGEGGLASRCFDSARSHEPTSIAVWEAMGDASLRRGWLAGGGGGGTDPRVSASLREAADAYEHAQLLGGDVESRLGFVLGSMLLRGGAAAAEGSVLAAASKAAAMQPLLPAAHAARGLALEARGDYGSAAQALQTALALMSGGQEPPATAAGDDAAPASAPRPLRAIASGGQARHYRTAAVAARAAAARCQVELAALPAEPPAAAAAAQRPAVVPGLPPAMALAMAAAVRSLAVLSECRLQLRGREGSAAAAAATGGADVGTDWELSAREAAEEALRLAQAHAADPSPAHRQCARIQALKGDMAAADAAYEQACKAAKAAAASATACAPGGGAVPTSYELLPLLEWAAVRMAAGEAPAAIQTLDRAWPAASPAVVAAVPRSRPALALTDVSSVQRALLLLQLGDVEGARSAAADAAAAVSGAAAAAVATGGSDALSAGLRAAAHTVQAAAALLQASAAAVDAGGDATGAAAARKRSLLEARWAARAALSALSPAPVACPAEHVQPAHRAAAGGRRGALAVAPAGPAGAGAALAAMLLGLVEAALGKEELAREAEQAVSGGGGRGPYGT